MQQKVIINKNNLIEASKILFGMILTGRFVDIVPAVIKDLTYAVKNNSIYGAPVQVGESVTKQIVDKFLQKYTKFLIEKNKKKHPSAGTDLSADKVDIDEQTKTTSGEKIKNKETKKNIFINRGNIEKHLYDSLLCFLNSEYMKFNDVFIGNVKKKLRANRLYKNNVTPEFTDSELTYLSQEFYKILVKFLKVGA